MIVLLNSHKTNPEIVSRNNYHKRTNVMLCAIWFCYHLYNLKNVQNTHGEVLLFNKSNTPPWVFFTFLNLYKWYQIAQSVTIVNGNG